MTRSRLLHLGKLLVRWVGPLVSGAVLLAALAELGRLDLRGALAHPLPPLFWPVFAVMYVTPALGDLVIYRRLWGRHCPGLADMLRKLVGNELLLGYVGDTYLFAAARGGGRRTIDVLRDVKDVTVLSAVAGSAVTLVAAAIAWPWLRALSVGAPPLALAAGLVAILAPPAIALVLGARLFGVPVAERWRIFLVHLVRATLVVLLTAWLWALALPAVAISLWLALSAAKLILARLPFIANRDVVFAAAVTALIGRGAPVSALLATVAAITVATHVAVGIVLAIAAVARRQRSASARK